MFNKICVFTGAGIGAPIGLPLTSGFESTINEIENSLLQQIKSHLSKPDSNDIEQIMYLLEDFTNSKDFTHHIILQGLNINGFREVNNHILSYKHQATVALNNIKGRIYELLENYQEVNATKLYSKLVSEIKDNFNHASISIFTTNYDMTFENAFADKADELLNVGINEVKYGFGGFGEGKKAKYNPNEEFNWESTVLEYKKLHGSLDWQFNKNNECIRLGDALSPKSPQTMPMLYPGFKGTPTKQPFIDLHEKLDQRLSDAGLVIVIGFAFRDDYLNNIFDYSIKKNQNLIVLCYNPCNLTDLPQDSKIKYFVNKYKDRFFYIQQGITVSEFPLKLEECLKTERIKHVMQKVATNWLM